MGTTIHWVTTKLPNMFSCVHQGNISGLPAQEICPQSNVRSPIPSPLDTPNNWLTVTLFGHIQHTHENIDKAVNMKPAQIKE